MKAFIVDGPDKGEVVDLPEHIEVGDLFYIPKPRLLEVKEYFENGTALICDAPDKDEYIVDSTGRNCFYLRWAPAWREDEEIWYRR